MNNDRFYERLQELKVDGTKVSVMQDSIDISIMPSYYKISKKIKKELDDDYDYLSDVYKLYDPETDVETKQKLLCSLASFEKPEYFNALKKFKDFAPAELKDWAIVATQESKMFLETALLDTQTLYISTGLGGKEEALRFFIVLFHTDEQPFSDSQKQLIEKEFAFSFGKETGEIEEIVFEKSYVKIVSLLPFEKHIYTLVKDIVEECNNYGNFIKSKLLVTNVKKLSNEEIELLYKKIDSDESGEIEYGIEIPE